MSISPLNIARPVGGVWGGVFDAWKGGFLTRVGSAEKGNLVPPIKNRSETHQKVADSGGREGNFSRGEDWGKMGVVRALFKLVFSFRKIEATDG
jgi:hypothetical protein